MAEKIIRGDRTSFDVDLVFFYSDSFNNQRGWQLEMLHHTFIAPYNTGALRRLVTGGNHNPQRGAWFAERGQQYWAFTGISPDLVRLDNLICECLNLEGVRQPYDVTYKSLTKYGSYAHFPITQGMAGLSRPSYEVVLRFSEEFVWLLFGLPSPLGRFVMAFDSFDRDQNNSYHPYGLYKYG